MIPLVLSVVFGVAISSFVKRTWNRLFGKKTEVD